MDPTTASLIATEALVHRIKQREAEDRFSEHLPWLASFGALENDEVRRNVLAGLAGAIVGAPAVEE